MVHFSVPVSVGGGVAGYLTTSRYSTITPGGDTKMKRRVIDSDALFFAEPAIKGEINLTTSIRLYATVGWMLTGGLDLVNTESNQMNGLTLQGGITLGRR